MSDHDMTGWQFADVTNSEWQEAPDGSPYKLIGAADGMVFVLSKLDAGDQGERHTHAGAEFLYLLEGDLSVNGVAMKPGHGYAAAMGSTHSEFSSRGGAKFVTLLKLG